ncbi:heme ABC transporter substrate-binding protein IsdE, partial [Staphylococcus aureus]|nr:heme ABC transporter substrate-binding protein IsdE [Staphylococcus aureus]
MRKTRIIFTIILFIVLLSGCEADDSNKKKDKAESKDIRIVPTTVALTMTLDNLELTIVGKPTNYKKLPHRYKNVTQ